MILARKPSAHGTELARHLPNLAIFCAKDLRQKQYETRHETENGRADGQHQGRHPPDRRNRPDGRQPHPDAGRRTARR